MSLSSSLSLSRTCSALRKSSAIVVIRSFAALSEASSWFSALSSASSRSIATSRLAAEHSTPPRTPCALLSPSCSGVGLSPSPLLPLVQSPPTPRLFEHRLVSRDYARIGESVKPVRGKAGAGIALEVSRPQQFLDQDTAFTPAGFHAYADRRCP